MLLLKLRNRHFFLLDLVLLALTPAIALTLRDYTAPGGSYAQALLAFTLIALGVKLPLFYAFGLYNRYWRYASIDEMVNIITAVLVAMFIVTGVFFGAQAFKLLFNSNIPRSLPFLDGLLTLLMVSGTRFAARTVEYRRAQGRPEANRRKVLIVGAGRAGAMLARDMQASLRYHLEPVGFIDDASDKHRTRIYGVEVLGPRTRLAELLKEAVAQEVIIAMPSAPGKVVREIVQICEQAQVPSRILPGMYEVLSGRVSVSQVREVEIEDLLRREPVETDLTTLRQLFAGKRILVTGAGGSIGSELCRQIVPCLPAQLIALGHGENSLFALGQELHQLQDNTPFRYELVVADVRDQGRLAQLFARYRPQVVFHAAAHKHVPLMEDNLEDAITNNVEGTRNVAELAAAQGVERLVLISTDKAVNPVSVMGVTKRVAELIVADVAQRAGRPFVSVRFGNVLGSRGSVVPTFRQQIAAGGPITVTHPDVERYFMTIPEAVQLVLQAGALGAASEVFVLDMGQPIKMVDLAADLVRLSGLQLGRDIDVVFTGLRPGEKMREELFGTYEQFSRTRHTKLFVARHDLTHLLQGAALHEALAALLAAAHAGEREQISGLLQKIVPEYTPLPPRQIEVPAAPVLHVAQN